MSKPRIITVCKYNQARSITSAAVLRRFFPEYEVLSAGIQANPLDPIPASIVEILHEWEVTEFDNRSTKVVDLPALNETDLVLCADAEVKTKLIDQLNIINIGKYKIRTLEEFSHSSLEIPVDPVSMDQSDTKTQLARAVILSVRAVRQEFKKEQPISYSLFPQDKVEHLQAQQKLLESIDDNLGLIIDSGFAIPNPLLWRAHNSSFVPINPNRLEVDSNTRNHSGILISKFEIDRSARIFLSENYFYFLQDLAEQQKIYLLAQPHSELPRARHHEAILSLIHS